MSDARREILARVRGGCAKSAFAAETTAPVRDAPAAPASLVAQFAQEAGALGCVVHGPVEPHDATDVVLAILRELHAHSLLAWGAAELPLLGLADALQERGFRMHDPTLPTERGGRAQALARLDAVDVGLTGALAGLADTGSLVLASGGERGRLAWLLPPVQLALLPLRLLLPSLDDFLAAGGAAVEGRANVCVVTGPSRSGDIEQVLTRGVHGPGAVHVLLVG